MLGDLVGGGDAVGLHKTVRDLVLGKDEDGVLAADGDGGEAGELDGLEGVLNLVQEALGREDRDVLVVSTPAHCCLCVAKKKNCFLEKKGLNVN